MKRRNSFDSSGGRSAWTTIGLVVGLAFFLISGALAYHNIRTLREDDAAIRHSHTVMIAVDELLSSVQDAETGQRGYLLTGVSSYLEPYTNATRTLGASLDRLQDLVQDNDVQQDNVTELRRHVRAKLEELQDTINARRTRGLTGALAIVGTDRGKISMDAIRTHLASMAQEENRLRKERLAEMATASRMAIAGGMVSSMIGAALTLLIFVLVHRNQRARAREDWLQDGLLGISAAVRGDRSSRRSPTRCWGIWPTGCILRPARCSRGRRASSTVSPRWAFQIMPICRRDSAFATGCSAGWPPRARRSSSTTFPIGI